MAQECRFCRRPHRENTRQSGQTTIFVVLVLGLFLIAAIGFAIDYSQVWFRRQAAQAAADAACQAGAMDMYLIDTTGFSNGAHFAPPTKFKCSDYNPTDCASITPTACPAPCRYAYLNGYNTKGFNPATESQDVNVSFPNPVPGVPTPSEDLIALAPVPFIQVDVMENVPVWFSSILTRNRFQPVKASAVCGLQEANAPIPLIVLNTTCQHSFEFSGSSSLTIVGGPTKSVQVNSGNSLCAAAGNNSSKNCDGGGTVDLSRGGPDFNGSSFGVWGAPSSPSVTFKGTQWLSGSPPISDPFARVNPPPRVPGTVGTVTTSGYHDPTYGCPDKAGCLVYTPGFYNKPIVVKGETALFVPGIYYIEPSDWSKDYAGSVRGRTYAASPADCAQPGSGCSPGPKGNCRADFLVEDQGVVRLSTARGDDNKGLMFYLSGSGGNYGSAVFTSNSGKAGSREIDSVPSTTLSCDGSKPDDRAGVPSSLVGDILVGQCTKAGTYVGSGSPGEGPGNIRGLVFFQDRSNGDQNGQSSMQGGGGLAISGAIYAHHCTATPCLDPPDNYQAFLQFQGATQNSTYMLGEIVADQVGAAGKASVAMQLNSNYVYHVLKVALLK